jgi:hypothetical protein
MQEQKLPARAAKEFRQRGELPKTGRPFPPEQSSSNRIFAAGILNYREADGGAFHDLDSWTSITLNLARTGRAKE